MQAVRSGIRALVSSSSSLSSTSRSFNVTPPSIISNAKGGSVIGLIGGARVFSQSASAYSPSNSLEKEEVTSRVLDLLKSISFIDPSKVSPTANFKDDLQLDLLDNVEVMISVEEEFAVDIPDHEAQKISTAAHLIDYIATHPQAQ